MNDTKQLEDAIDLAAKALSKAETLVTVMRSHTDLEVPVDVAVAIMGLSQALKELKAHQERTA